MGFPMSKYLQNALLEFNRKPISYTKYKSTIMDGPKVLFLQIEAMLKRFSDHSLLPIIQQSIQQKTVTLSIQKRFFLLCLGDELMTTKQSEQKLWLWSLKLDAIMKEKPTMILPLDLESVVFPDVISMQSATLKSSTLMKKDEQLLPIFQTMTES